jgi:uncharacterized protein
MKSKLQGAMKSAMKAKDKLRLDTIRGVLSAIQYEEMEKKVESLPEAGVLEVLKREFKKRKEQLEFAVQGGRSDIKQQLDLELKVLEEFLPKQLSSQELETIIGGFKKDNPALNMGAAMKALKESYAGQYDSKEASDIAKRLLP